MIINYFEINSDSAIDIDIDSIKSKVDIVYLCGSQSIGSFYVTDSIGKAISYFKNFAFNEPSPFHLQEYESFESALSVALMWAEPNKLCYDKNA